MSTKLQINDNVRMRYINKGWIGTIREINDGMALISFGYGMGITISLTDLERA